MKHRRISCDEKKINRDRTYDEEELHVDPDATKRFRKKAYEVKVPPELQINRSMLEYLARKYDIKKEVEQ